MITFAMLAACGGFLIAILWIDLTFDVQTLRHRDATLPEPALASIAGYYRHVTREAAPTHQLVGGVMAAAVAFALAQLVVADAPWASVLTLLLAGGPIALMQLRVVPAATRLGAQQDTPETQTRLARAICRDHLLCLAAVVAFTALQLLSVP